MPAQGATPPRAPRSTNKTRANKGQVKKAREQIPNPKIKSKATIPPKPVGGIAATPVEAPDQIGSAPVSRSRKRKPVKPKTQTSMAAPEGLSPPKPKRRRIRSDLLPHEVLLAVARGEVIADHVPTFEERVEAAKAAAPYFAPKGTASSKPVKTLAHEEALAALDQAEPASPQLVRTIDGEGNDRQKT